MLKRSPNPASARSYVTHRLFRVFQRSVGGGFRALRKRVSSIEVTLDPLIDHVAHTERELQDLDHRVTRLERQRGRRLASDRRR